MRIPWRDRGRTTNGADCWGLVRLVFIREFGLDLPVHGGSTAWGEAASGAIQAGAASPPWQFQVVLGTERTGDVVVFKTPDRLGFLGGGHVGVVTGPGHVLHSEPHAGPMLQSLSWPPLRRRIISIHRHEALL